MLFSQVTLFFRSQPCAVILVNIHIREVETGKDVINISQEKGPVNGVAFSLNSKFVALSDSDRMIHIWNIPTKQLVVRITSPEYVNRLALSPDGKLIAVGGGEVIRIWDVSSGKQVVALVNCGLFFDFSPDGKLLGFSGLDNNIYLWDITNNHMAGQIPSGMDSSNLLFSPRGDLLATYAYNDKSVHIWNVATRDEMRQILLDETVTALIFDASGKLLVTGSKDKTARIWDLSSGKEMKRVLHDGNVTALAFSSDGKLLATGGDDKTARVWEVLTGQELGRMLHDYQVSLVAFDPENKIIISSANTTRIWTWKIDDLINEACKRALRNFTRAEWSHYFPDEKYKVTCPNLPIELEFTPTPDLVSTSINVLPITATPSRLSTPPLFPMTQDPVIFAVTSVAKTAIVQTATAFVASSFAQTATAYAQPYLSATPTPTLTPTP